MNVKKWFSKSQNRKTVIVSICLLIGYVLALIGLALSYSDCLWIQVVGLAVIVLLALPCLFVPLFYTPIKKRKLHRAALKNYEITTPFIDIDNYNSDSKYKASYADRIMYINHFYKEKYMKNDHILSDDDMKDLSKRLIYLEEMVRNDDLMNGFIEALILSVLFPFIKKDPDGNEWAPIAIFFLAIVVYFVYYFIIRLTDKVNETVKLNEYEIRKIKAIIADADTPGDDKNWREKKEQQVVPDK